MKLTKLDAKNIIFRFLVYIYKYVDNIYFCFFFDRRLGGESKPGNLNGSCERDPEAGVLEFD